MIFDVMVNMVFTNNVDFLLPTTCTLTFFDK